MQPVRPPLPELQFQRPYPVATPSGRQGHLPIGKALLQVVPLHLQQRAGADHRALLRHPGPHPATKRPRHEIGQRFGRGDPRSRTQDGHLPLQAIPGEQQAHLLGGVNLERLAAAVVAEEHKAPLIEGLEQHRAAAGPLAVTGGEHHGIGLQQFGRAGLLEPQPELIHRIGSQVGAPQTTTAVVAAQLAQVISGHRQVAGHRSLPIRRRWPH